jgi:hypothetical protein
MSVDQPPAHKRQHGMPDRASIEQEFHRILNDIQAGDPRFAFDRDGRPGAIAAVRAALPAIERELFDAVIEDCECELAATREALFQMILLKS